MIYLSEKMLAFAKEYKWVNSNTQLIIKIGLHYGKVITGLIGYHKPQFSLIGDVVNTTSRIT